MNTYKDKRDESLTDEEEALVALSIDENYLLKSNLIDIHVLWVIGDALEKQIPKPIVGIKAQLQNRYCPSCNEWMFFDKYGQAKYCPTCGQALDWRNEDE